MKKQGTFFFHVYAVAGPLAVLHFFVLKSTVVVSSSIQPKLSANQHVIYMPAACWRTVCKHVFGEINNPAIIQKDLKAHLDSSQSQIKTQQIENREVKLCDGLRSTFSTKTKISKETLLDILCQSERNKLINPSKSRKYNKKTSSPTDSPVSQ